MQLRSATTELPEEIKITSEQRDSRLPVFIKKYYNDTNKPNHKLEPIAAGPYKAELY